MIRDITIKGLLLGITAGLLITIFDGLLMLEPGIYVPYSYPFVLIIFNVLFWAIIGSVSGFLFWVFTKKEDVKGKGDFYWVLFFLVPFCLIYGILGRIHIPHVTVVFRQPNFVFDHHLSFLWVSLILVFLVFYFRKLGGKKEFPSIFFAFEIVTFILLFQFCSNLIYVKKNCWILF